MRRWWPPATATGGAALFAPFALGLAGTGDKPTVSASARWRLGLAALVWLCLLALAAVAVDGEEQALDDCVMTFAYWDPRFLRESRLLNPQSGEYVAVDVESLGRQEVIVRGAPMQASAYRVRARATELVVWYSDDDEWLGLESVARGGRIIRYELT